MVCVREPVVLGLIIMSSMYCNGQELTEEDLKNKLVSPHASALALVKAPPTPPPARVSPPPVLVKAPHPPPPARVSPPPAPAPLPPVKAPAPPPPFTIRAAIEGVVYCMSCKLPGYVPSMKASPLPNATANLACMTNNAVTSHGNATTNARGYFLIQVQNRKPSTVDKCRVILKLPVWCDVPIIPKSRRAGIPIKFEKIDRVGSSQYVLFTVGFLEFGPTRPRMCPRLP